MKALTIFRVRYVAGLLLIGYSCSKETGLDLNKVLMACVRKAGMSPRKPNGKSY